MNESDESLTQARIRVMIEFADAYNRHDVDTILALMTEDCEFLAFAGTQPCGERFTGQSAVRARVASGLRELAGARWVGASHHVVADRGFSEWTFEMPLPDGSHVRRDGVDVFGFDGTRIRSKSTFQKWVTKDEER
jgi:ketosteroid isomerase-like protein